jgi:hypothetical protein
MPTVNSVDITLFKQICEIFHQYCNLSFVPYFQIHKWGHKFICAKKNHEQTYISSGTVTRRIHYYNGLNAWDLLKVLCVNNFLNNFVYKNFNKHRMHL